MENGCTGSRTTWSEGRTSLAIFGATAWDELLHVNIQPPLPSVFGEKFNINSQKRITRVGVYYALKFMILWWFYLRRCGSRLIPALTLWNVILKGSYGNTTSMITWKILVKIHVNMIIPSFLRGWDLNVVICETVPHILQDHQVVLWVCYKISIRLLEPPQYGWRPPNVRDMVFLH